MSNYVLWNGELSEQFQVGISLSNRSFRYGDGLFETIKVADSFPLFYKTHHSRLVRGLDALELTIPEFFRYHYFREKLLLLIEKSGMVNGFLRLQAFRSGKGTYGPETSIFDWVVEVVQSDAETPFFMPNNNPYCIDVFEGIKKSYSKISFFKSSNAQVYVLAAIEAKRRELDNLIILNQDDHCIETISENLFLFKNGLVTTPPLEDGPIEGVMRTMVKKILKWNHINFEERSISIQDIEQAEECFLTNISIGIQPVTQFRNQSFDSSFTIGLREKLNERIANLLTQKDKL